MPQARNVHSDSYVVESTFDTESATWRSWTSIRPSGLTGLWIARMAPMSKDLPLVPDAVFPVNLEGERVSLRELEPEDAAPLTEVFGDPEVVRLQTVEPQTLEMLQQWISTVSGTARGPIRDQYVLCVLHDGQVIGTARIGVSHREFRRGDVGYSYRRQVWGNGFGTETLRCLLGFGFSVLNLHRVEAIHHPDNVASARVLEEVGMERDGYFRHHRFVKGKWWDSVQWAIISQDEPAV